MVLPIDNKNISALKLTPANNQSSSFSSINLGGISNKISKLSTDLNEKLSSETNTNNPIKKLNIGLSHSKNQEILGNF